MHPVKLVALVFVLAIASFSVLESSSQLRAEEDLRSFQEIEREALDLFRKGRRLANEKKYVEALRAWTRAFVNKLPQYRGLEFRYPVQSHFMTRAKLRDFLLDNFRKEYPPERVEADQFTLRLFGLFPDDLDLHETLVSLYSEEIAGFYDPDTKGLYLIAEEADPKPKKEKKSLWKKLFNPGPRAFDPNEQRILLAHEMQHALADQHFDLFSLMRSAESDEDMMVGIQGLVEGEAMLTMMMDASTSGRGDGRDVLRASETMADWMATITNMGSSLSTGKTFRTAPLILQESLLFPYTQGMRFCAHLATRGGWPAINKAFRNPPLSTEQILHPEKYTTKRDDPVAIAFPKSLPKGVDGDWELVKEGVLGEFGIEVWLRPELGRNRSLRVAAGWDGDSYRCYRRKKENGAERRLIWTSTWDSKSEAQEFFLGVSEAVEHRVGRIRLTDVDLEDSFAWTVDEGIAAVVKTGLDVHLVQGVDRKQLATWVKWLQRAKKTPKTFELKVQKPKNPFQLEEIKPTD